MDEVSPRKIRNYLHRWVTWWVNASEVWNYHELLQRFLDQCWSAEVAEMAAILLKSQDIKKLYTDAPRTGVSFGLEYGQHIRPGRGLPHAV